MLRRPGHQRRPGRSCGTAAAPNALLVNEGHDSAMEFAEGNFGLIQGALEYHNDTTAPQTTMEFSSAQTSGDPINFKFDWLGEGAIIYYTTDGSTPVIVPTIRHAADERCANTTTTKCYNGQGPRRPGEVLDARQPGRVHRQVDGGGHEGQRLAVKTQRLLVAADDADGTVGGTVPATLSLSLGTRRPSARSPRASPRTTRRPRRPT